MVSQVSQRCHSHIRTHEGSKIPGCFRLRCLLLQVRPPQVRSDWHKCSNNFAETEGQWCNQFRVRGSAIQFEQKLIVYSYNFSWLSGRWGLSTKSRTCPSQMWPKSWKTTSYPPFYSARGRKVGIHSQTHRLPPWKDTQKETHLRIADADPTRIVQEDAGTSRESSRVAQKKRNRTNGEKIETSGVTK